MENLLTIDCGNSKITLASYQADGLKQVFSENELEEGLKEKTKTVLTSTVGRNCPNWEGPNFISLKSLIKDNKLFSMPINYSQELGEDRLATAYSVYKNWIGKVNRVMLIDAGTFTTIDLITNDGFEGGHIFAGTDTLLKSFSNGTQLPRLRIKEIKEDQHLPKSTESAIYGSIMMAERGLYEKWWDRFKPELIVLTGGLAFWHKKYLPEQAVLEDHLVHLGLYEAFKDMSQQ